MENMIGLDLGKCFFQVHCADNRGKKLLRLRRDQIVPFRVAAARGDGDLRRCSGLAADGIRGETHPGPVREAVRQVEQERRAGCEAA